MCHDLLTNIELEKLSKGYAAAHIIVKINVCEIGNSFIVRFNADIALRLWEQHLRFIRIDICGISFETAYQLQRFSDNSGYITAIVR